jgi:hypothetical protein
MENKEVGMQNEYGTWVGRCYKGINLNCPKCGDSDFTKVMTIYCATDEYGVFNIDLNEIKRLKGYELFCFKCDELVGYDLDKSHPLWTPYGLR